VQTPAGRQLVTAAAPWVIAYDPADGRQLWKAAVLDGDVGPSPAYGAGMVFVANEGSQLAAIRTDGTGDVTATHVAWTSHDALPNIVTPLATEQLLLMPIDFGTIHCFEAATGKVLWSHETAASFHSSPVRVGKHAYLTDTSGLTWVLELGDAYKELAKCPLAEPVSATPVLVGGRWYIRSKDNLYCLGVT
jgi:outer membrane protein assembly factor BamB